MHSADDEDSSNSIAGQSQPADDALRPSARTQQAQGVDGMPEKSIEMSTPVASPHELTGSRGLTNNDSLAPKTACGCDSGGVATASAQIENRPAFVYAIGQIEMRFPNLAAEKEFAQVVGRIDTSGLTDRQVFHTVLSNREHRYLLRQLCYVFLIQDMDSYLMLPRDPMDLDLIVDAIRPDPSSNNIDVVIGSLGPIAPPELCNGLSVPMVIFDQIYSFERDALIDSIPKGDGAKKFNQAASEIFDRIMDLADNAGAADEHRAVNYLAVRYPGIYSLAAEQFGKSCSLTDVHVQPAPVAIGRNHLDVIFSYTNRTTDFTEKFAVRVDVTEEFPFLVRKLGPYYDRT